MIKIYYKTLKSKGLEEIKESKIGSWIYIENPTDMEMDRLASQFNLEKDLLNDALDPYEVPRIEQEGGVAYVFTRVPFQDNNRVVTAPVLIGIGPSFVFTVSKEPLPFLNKFINSAVDFSTTQKNKLFLQIFSQINSVYSNFIMTMSRQVRAMSGKLENVNNKTIIKFVTFEEILNDFLAALIPTNSILKDLLLGKTIKLYEEDEDLVEDMLHANGQLAELTKSNLKTIVNIREAYSTIMTNNLNRIIKFLTVLTIVLNIPMIIASFYGMNVSLPIEKTPGAFWWILIFTVTISVILLGIFNKKRWLE